MGLAIIVPNVSFGDANLGKVTLSGNVPIRGLYINLEDSYAGTAVDLKCSYLPANTTQRNVVWSIESGSEYAFVSGSVLTILEGADSDEVVVKCTSVSNPSIYAEKTISVTYQSAGIVWHDFTDDMIITNRVIDSSNGQIQNNTIGTTRKVLLLPIPNGAAYLKVKIIGSAINTNDTMSFINDTEIPIDKMPMNCTHFVNWNSTTEEQIGIPIQTGDKSVVLWQQINDTIYGINNKQYAFI